MEGKRKTAYLVGAFLAGVVFHWLWGFSQTGISKKNLPLREPVDYPLISPLLLCSAEDTSENLNRNLLAITKEAAQDNESRTGVEEIAVYVRNLTSGQWAGYNENSVYTPASLNKLPTMIAFYRYANSHPDYLSTPYHIVLTEDYNQGEHFNTSTKIPPDTTIEDLIRRMIIHSDNNATFLLYGSERLDQDNFDKVYTDIGLSAPPRDERLIKFISPKTYAFFFRLLYNATYIGQQASEHALELLAASDFKKGLVAGVPAGIRVAHKFGERTLLDKNGSATSRELHDCGIVYKPKDPYVICVMTKGNDLEKQASAISDISKKIYQADWSSVVQ